MTPDQNEPPMTAMQMLAAARKSVPEMNVAQVKAALDEGRIDLLLDVREADEWARGHIPGAIHVPRGLLEWYADPETPYAMPQLTANRAAHIVVHCATGSRSLLAAQTLRSMGYSNAVSMLGGIEDWMLRGYPVERTTE
jgi:rhodanese-related sulfurtransferase